MESAEINFILLDSLGYLCCLRSPCTASPPCPPSRRCSTALATDNRAPPNVAPNVGLRFRIRSSGSEFINRTVVQLLEKLPKELTMSRLRRRNDGLVERKNGAVIRKHIGYGYIHPRGAEALNSSYRDHLNLLNPVQYLRPRLSSNALRRIPAAISDTAVARQVQQAKLFDRLDLSARSSPRRKTEWTK
jgi:hypothetical protein